MQNLDDILRGYTSDELGAIVDYLEAPVRNDAPKNILVSEISSYIQGSTTQWLQKLPENDLRLLLRLVNAGPGKKLLLLRPDYPTVCEVLKIIENDREQDFDTVEVWLSDTMHSIIAPHIRRVVAAKDADGSFEIERMITGMLNAYGVIPLSSFLVLFFSLFDVDDDELISLSAKIASCPILKLYQDYYKGTAYLVSPYVAETKEILEERRLHFKEIRKYAPCPPGNDIAGAGQNPPFCVYGLNTPEGRALQEMLIDELGFSGDELQEALHTVWIDSQFAFDNESTACLFSVVTDRQDELGSFELFRQCIETVVAYANSIPKWLLKGHSANETGTMKITVRVDELIREYNYDEPGFNLYKLGFAVKPVAPEEPCPCGSGLSYRFCHGRLKN